MAIHNEVTPFEYTDMVVCYSFAIAMVHLGFDNLGWYNTLRAVHNGKDI